MKGLRCKKYVVHVARTALYIGVAVRRAPPLRRLPTQTLVEIKCKQPSGLAKAALPGYHCKCHHEPSSDHGIAITGTSNSGGYGVNEMASNYQNTHLKVLSWTADCGLEVIWRSVSYRRLLTRWDLRRERRRLMIKPDGGTESSGS